MTRNEAMERARRIWGEDQVYDVWYVGRQNDLARPRYTPPGEDEWRVSLHNTNDHYLDCNGHATCHQECADAEVQVCP